MFVHLTNVSIQKHGVSNIQCEYLNTCIIIKVTGQCVTICYPDYNFSGRLFVRLYTVLCQLGGAIGRFTCLLCLECTLNLFVLLIAMVDEVTNTCCSLLALLLHNKVL